MRWMIEMVKQNNLQILFKVSKGEISFTMFEYTYLQIENVKTCLGQVAYLVGASSVNQKVAGSISIEFVWEAMV